MRRAALIACGLVLGGAVLYPAFGYFLGGSSASTSFTTGAFGDGSSRGPTGPTGPMGPQGATGPAGATGSPGPQGVAGSPGSPGSDGATGPTGPIGPQGAAGAVGPAGPQGVPGSNGTNGTDGARGPTGPAGQDGQTGQTGQTGPQGPDGARGPAGADGVSGREVIVATAGQGGHTACPSESALGNTCYVFASCSAGKVLVGGGAWTSDEAHTYMAYSSPNPALLDTQWFVASTVIRTGGNGWTVKAIAICASVNP